MMTDDETCIEIRRRIAATPRQVFGAFAEPRRRRRRAAVRQTEPRAHRQADRRRQGQRDDERSHGSASSARAMTEDWKQSTASRSRA